MDEVFGRPEEVQVCPRCGGEDLGKCGYTELRTETNVTDVVECMDCAWAWRRPSTPSPADVASALAVLAAAGCEVSLEPYNGGTTVVRVEQSRTVEYEEPCSCSMFGG